MKYVAEITQYGSTVWRSKQAHDTYEAAHKEAQSRGYEIFYTSWRFAKRQGWAIEVQKMYSLEDFDVPNVAFYRNEDDFDLWEIKIGPQTWKVNQQELTVDYDGYFPTLVTEGYTLVARIPINVMLLLSHNNILGTVLDSAALEGVLKRLQE